MNTNDDLVIFGASSVFFSGLKPPVSAAPWCTLAWELEMWFLGRCWIRKIMNQRCPDFSWEQRQGTNHKETNQVGNMSWATAPTWCDWCVFGTIDPNLWQICGENEWTRWLTTGWNSVFPWDSLAVSLLAIYLGPDFIFLFDSQSYHCLS